MQTLDEALANVREYASMLRATGMSTVAERVDDLASCIDVATEDVRRWVCEADASLASGLATRTLRRRFSEWLVTGHARYNARNEREYRLDIVRRKPGLQQSVRARVRHRLGRPTT